MDPVLVEAVTRRLRAGSGIDRTLQIHGADITLFVRPTQCSLRRITAP